MRSRKLKNHEIWITVIINLIPLVGVFFLRWDIFSVIFFYWLEAFLPYMRLFFSWRQYKSDPASKSFAILTGFLFIVGIIVIAFFGSSLFDGGEIKKELLQEWLVIILILVISNVASYISRSMRGEKDNVVYLHSVSALRVLVIFLAFTVGMFLGGISGEFLRIFVSHPLASFAMPITIFLVFIILKILAEMFIISTTPIGKKASIIKNLHQKRIKF